MPTPVDPAQTRNCMGSELRNLENGRLLLALVWRSVPWHTADLHDDEEPERSQYMKGHTV